MPDLEARLRTDATREEQPPSFDDMLVHALHARGSRRPTVVVVMSVCVLLLATGLVLVRLADRGAVPPGVPTTAGSSPQSSTRPVVRAVVLDAAHPTSATVVVDASPYVEFCTERSVPRVTLDYASDGAVRIGLTTSSAGVTVAIGNDFCSYRNDEIVRLAHPVSGARVVDAISGTTVPVLNPAAVVIARPPAGFAPAGVPRITSSDDQSVREGSDVAVSRDYRFRDAAGQIVTVAEVTSDPHPGVPVVAQVRIGGHTATVTDDATTIDLSGLCVTWRPDDLWRTVCWSGGATGRRAPGAPSGSGSPAPPAVSLTDLVEIARALP